jgi:hypothetical protein
VISYITHAVQSRLVQFVYPWLASSWDIIVDCPLSYMYVCMYTLVQMGSATTENNRHTYHKYLHLFVASTDTVYIY